MDALTKGWFGFRFNCASDVEKILVKHWSYGAVPILLKKWTPLFDADSERLETMLVWVRLPRLPWEFWNPNSLRDLGNALGVFLEVDLSFMKTRRKTIARILVSLNIRTYLREQINIIWGDSVRNKLLDCEGLQMSMFPCNRTYRKKLSPGDFKSPNIKNMAPKGGCRSEH